MIIGKLEEKDMYNKILVPLDGSLLSECVLPHVESMLKGCSIKEVVFIRIVEPMPIPYAVGEYQPAGLEFEQIEKSERVQARNYLEKLIERMKTESVKFSYEVLVDGQVAPIISDYASQNDVDLIVIATHGRSGITRWAMGSVADRILRSSCAPVLMIRAPGCTPGI